MGAIIGILLAAARAIPAFRDVFIKIAEWIDESRVTKRQQIIINEYEEKQAKLRELSERARNTVSSSPDGVRSSEGEVSEREPHNGGSGI